MTRRFYLHVQTYIYIYTTQPIPGNSMRMGIVYGNSMRMGIVYGNSMRMGIVYGNSIDHTNPIHRPPKVLNIQLLLPLDNFSK